VSDHSANSDSVAANLAEARQLDLASYIALVNRCAEGRLNQELSNGSPFHARILISKLFEVARKRVQIVTGSLKDTTRPEQIEIYGFRDVIARAQRFLREPSSRLTIIVQSGQVDQGNQNRFLKQVVEDQHRNGLVDLLIATPNRISENVPHFMISDAYAYRFEPGKNAQPTDQGTTAIGNFGDPTFAGKLEKYFGNLIEILHQPSSLAKHLVFPPNHLHFSLNE
jgi:hypothetical protein